MAGLAKAGLGAIAAAGAAAVTAVSGVAVSSVKLASDLNEVQNVVDVTFGEQGAEKIEAWSKAARDAYGLSTLQAKQYTGTMGAMLKSMGLADDEILNMSTDMVGLAGDFASFYNLNAEDAFYKIRAGISGETEPLKQLGINMSVANLEAFALSQGIDKAYNSMSQAEQATLRYNYLMSVSADAQGDFTRTQDSLANQMRIASLQVQELGAAIGQSLLPMATDAVKVGNEMLTALREGFEKGGVSGMLDAATGVITQLAQGLASKIPALVETSAQLLGALLTGLYNALPSLASAALAIVEALYTSLTAQLPSLLATGGNMLSGIMQGLYAALPGLLITALSLVDTLGSAILNGAPELLASGTELLHNVLTGIQNSLPDVLATATDLVVNLATGILQNLPAIFAKGQELLLTLITGISEMLPSIAQAAGDIISGLLLAFVENWPDILASGRDMVVNVIKGLLEMLPDIANAAGDLARKLVDALFEIDWIQLGKDIIQGLIDGVGAMAGLLWDAAVAIASSFLEGVKGFFGIHSPSTVMRDEVGKMLPRGAAIGVEDDTPEAVRSVDRMAEEMLAAADRVALDAQNQVGTAAVAKVMEHEPTPEPQNKDREPRQFVQNINFYEPVPAPDETARAIRIQETYGLAGDQDE